MVKVNLLPREDFQSQPLGKFLKWTLSWGRYIIISVELVVFLVFFSRFIFDQRLADINDRIEQKQAIVASASDFENQVRDIQNRIEKIQFLDTGRTIYLTVLNKLEQLTPLDLVYSSINFEAETVTIEGETPTNESFAKLVTSLKSDDLFSEITINSVGRENAEKNQTEESKEYVVRFTLTVKIKGYNNVKASPTPSADMPSTNQEGESGL